MMTRLLSLFVFLAVASGFSPVNPSTRALLTTALAASSDAAETVKVGDKLPDVTLAEGQADYGSPSSVKLLELIAGKKVAIFAVPGAFTPGCSKSHLPSFMDAQDELKAKGVELTICIATNDAYVMEAWGTSSGGSDAGIMFLSDSTGDLTEALGMVMGSPMMTRSKRYSLIADDGVVTHFFSSEEESSNTWAPSVLAAL